MSGKEALKRVAFWISIALAFNLGVWYFMKGQKALEFFGGYLIELSLSVDNLFLFLMVFQSFGIEPKYQKRVLNYGIAGAIIMRLIFIVIGVKVIESFEWVLYVFGIILIFSAFKMFFGGEEEKDFKESKILNTLKRIVPITEELHEEKFFIKKNGVLFATPLLAILVIVEFTDIMFAIDSIPAVFSVTKDAFIVYTSNIFAILGLRSMYFLLLRLQERFQYVKYGVALILAFTGVKLSILYFGKHIDIITSLGFILGVLVLSIVFSLLISKKKVAHK